VSCKVAQQVLKFQETGIRWKKLVRIETGKFNRIAKISGLAPVMDSKTASYKQGGTQ